MSHMRVAIKVILAVAAMTCGCNTKTQTHAKTDTPVTASGRRLFLDVHHFGPGKVTAQDVAGAHAKDLAVQAKHDVRFVSYWFDPESGTVQCLADAPSAEAAVAVHREAHGLLPDSIAEVQEGH